MIYGSICSGIEAASVAWRPLGWRAAFLSEIDKFHRGGAGEGGGAMPTVKTDLERRLYGALRRIARDYETAERLVKHGEHSYGVSGEECLLMAYENLQAEAKNAIRGVRMPKVQS